MRDGDYIFIEHEIPSNLCSLRRCVGKITNETFSKDPTNNRIDFEVLAVSNNACRATHTCWTYKFFQDKITYLTEEEAIPLIIGLKLSGRQD
jgi:hypothetical protein